MICVRCASEGSYGVKAIGVADGRSLCGKHLWGHLYGARPYGGQFEAAAEAWARVDDSIAHAADPPPGGWVVFHNIEPREDAIMFGADSREVLPDESPLHPLQSTCRCGRQIMKERSDVPWQHVD